MMETELIDHIEVQVHKDDFKKLSIEQFRQWFKENFKIEERISRPGDGRYLRDVHSFGIATSERH